MNHFPDTQELIERLIGFDTVSRNSNLELINFVADLLDGLGIAPELTYDDDKRKANLWATFGPDDISGTVLSGHTDVVPVDGQAWTTDPFKLTRKDDSVFGRGTADMKGFIAICLSRAQQLQTMKLQRPVHYAFSFDEEVGCLGVPRLIEQVSKREVLPSHCIVGEPTGMEVVNGHKGKLATRCQVHGLESHSGLAHQGANAVEAAAEAIAYLKKMSRRHRDQGPFNDEFDPAYTTVHTGVVKGGSAINIVPNECSFDFEFRLIPGDDPAKLLGELKTYIDDELLPEMRSVYPEASFEWSTLSNYPSLLTEPDTDVVKLAQRLSGSTTTGKVSFGTEGGLFKAAGIDAVICGPGLINVAHKPDEHVSLDQIAKCEQFVDELITGHA